MDAADLIRALATGNASVSELAALGVLVEGEVPHLEVTVLAGIPAVQVSPGELSLGLLAAWARSTDLAEWAAVTREVVVLDGEDSPVWEILMNALWSAAFGEPIPEEVLALAQSLAG